MINTHTRRDAIGTGAETRKTREDHRKSPVAVRLFTHSDIDSLAGIISEAWRYHVHDIKESRIKELLEHYLSDKTTRFWIALEGAEVVGVAQVHLKKSFRCQGSEGHLELLYILDKTICYYDTHTALMDAIFEFLHAECVEYLRIDTTLENEDVLCV